MVSNSHTTKTKNPSKYWATRYPSIYRELKWLVSNVNWILIVQWIIDCDKIIPWICILPVYVLHVLRQFCLLNMSICDFFLQWQPRHSHAVSSWSPIGSKVHPIEPLSIRILLDLNADWHLMNWRQHFIILSDAIKHEIYLITFPTIRLQSSWNRDWNIAEKFLPVKARINTNQSDCDIFRWVEKNRRPLILLKKWILIDESKWLCQFDRINICQIDSFDSYF